MVSSINWSIELNRLKFFFRVFAVYTLERDASAREKFFNEKRALVPVAPGH